MKKLNKLLLMIAVFMGQMLFAQDQKVTYDQIDSASFEELLLISINDTVKEVYVLEESGVGLEDLSFEALLKVKIQESKIEQRSLTMQEIEDLSIEDLLKINGSMEVDQGVRVVELDLSDLSLEEIMSLNAITSKHVQIKKLK